MDRVREALARHRGELLDRWNRQLRAAAEAGFPLDSGTAEVLPRLLEVADRTLQRRFRPILPGTPSPDAARVSAVNAARASNPMLDANAFTSSPPRLYVYPQARPMPTLAARRCSAVSSVDSSSMRRSRRSRR